MPSNFVCIHTHDEHMDSRLAIVWENCFSTESEKQFQSAKKDEGKNDSVFTDEVDQGKKMEYLPYV